MREEDLLDSAPIVVDHVAEVFDIEEQIDGHVTDTRKRRDADFLLDAQVDLRPTVRSVVVTRHDLTAVASESSRIHEVVEVLLERRIVDRVTRREAEDHVSVITCAHLA